MDRLRYSRRISGPILDRIEIKLRVCRVSGNDLVNHAPQESSHAVRTRVLQAREIQMLRYGMTNSRLSTQEIKAATLLSPTGKHMLEKAIERLRLSARSYYRTLKLSRTIADLEGSAEVRESHIAESLSYRLET